MSRAIQPGTVLLCQDSHGARTFLRKGHFYTVTKTCYGGTMVYLDGITQPFATTRFEIVTTPSSQSHEVKGD